MSEPRRLRPAGASNFEQARAQGAIVTCLGVVGDAKGFGDDARHHLGLGLRAEVLALQLFGLS